MNTPKKGALLGALAAACVCIMSSHAANATAADSTNSATSPDSVVAKGKGFEIKRSTLDEEFLNLKAQSISEKSPISDAEKPRAEWYVLQQLVFRNALLARANAEDKTSGQTNADKYLADVHKKVSADQLSAQLKAIGKTIPQFEKEILETATCDAVLKREIQAKIKISDEEIKKFYDENTDQFEHGETVRVSHILVATFDKDENPLPPDKKKEKEKLAKEIKAKIDKGEDFAKLAKQYSDDPGSKDDGGEMPAFERGKMVREFEAAAFSMKTNQVSDLVESKYGYHIIKLWEKNPATKDTLAEATPKIKDYLVYQETRTQVPDYRTQLIKDADVKYFGISEPPPLPVSANAFDEAVSSGAFDAAVAGGGSSTNAPKAPVPVKK